MYIDSVKYQIHANIEVNGLVDKPDVIGAIFGQTEGLLGDELEMRELQKTGRIGRIEAELEHKSGKTMGKIIVPSGLGMVETAIVAAALETVDRVGPYDAKISVEKIEDTRDAKRKYLITRAKELLSRMLTEEIPDTKDVIERVKSELRISDVQQYGKEKLPAGPAVDESEEIIIVEGRADVLNLLKHGIKNVIAIGGNRIPRTIIDLARRKTTTLFVDGDRGGDLIIREMLQKADIDFITKAPDGKEVEELTQKEILKSLRRKIPADEYAAHVGLKKAEAKRKAQMTKAEKEAAKKEEAPPAPNVPPEYLKMFDELKGSLTARVLDESGNIVAEVPVREIWKKLKELEGAHAIIMDGIVTQRLVDAAAAKGVKYLIGVKKTKLERVPEELTIYAG
ncbi:MAG: DNA primase [Candidatus Diapherotrites archaeon]|nr:DNA primase [Candidatus Diapherotrites archaeon]